MINKPLTENELASIVLDCSFEVNSALGSGLLKSTYQICLEKEIRDRGLSVEVEKSLPIVYKDVEIKEAYRIDILVEKKLVVELKAVEELNDKHLAQILTYLRLGGFKLGLLLNFNEKQLKNGIKRVII